MNRLLFGMILLAVGCLAGSCTDDDEYTQGVLDEKIGLGRCSAGTGWQFHHWK